MGAGNYAQLHYDWMFLGFRQILKKKKGHGKALLQQVVDEAKAQGKDGIVTVVGTKKFHFMSDTKWLLKHGFEICENTPAGFSLISRDFGNNCNRPEFRISA